MKCVPQPELGNESQPELGNKSQRRGRETHAERARSPVGPAVPAETWLTLRSAATGRHSRPYDNCYRDDSINCESGGSAAG